MPEHLSPTMHAVAGVIRPGGQKPEDQHWLEALSTDYPTHFSGTGTFHTGPLSFRGNAFSESASGPRNTSFSGSIFNHADFPHHDNAAVLIQSIIIPSGLDAVAGINGQFTIIDVDSRDERIALINDHAGINQLFYYEALGFTLFASEIRFLLAHPECPCAIDWESSLRRPSPVTVLSSFIDYRTWFKDIFLLPEAGIYEFDVRQNTRSIRRYWDGLASVTPDPEDGRSADDVMREYMELLEDAVRIRCDTVGTTHAFLSGGLDSSAICALRPAGSALESYSIVTQTTCLEGTTAVCHDLAEELQIGNTQFLVPYHEISFDKELWKRRIWRAESPVSHTDSLTKTLLHYAIRRDVPEADVVLTGTGSDQYNGGLARYIVNEEETMAASAASLFRKVREAEMRKLIARDDEELWRMRDFLRRDYMAELNGESIEANFWNFYVRSALHGEVYSLLWDEVRAASSHGHSVRFPFLDYRFSEFIAAIPERLYADLFWDKRILREPAKALLPEYVLNKPKAPPYRPEYDIRFKLFEHLTSGPDSLLMAAFGDVDVPHPVVDKKHLFARVEALKGQPEIMEWQDVMQLINLALLEQLAGKTEADLRYKDDIQPERITFDDAAESYRALEARLGIRSPESKLDMTLAFAPQCSLLEDRRSGGLFLSKNNVLLYELDGSSPDWLRFLNAIDAGRSAAQIFADEDIDGASVMDFLQIALDDRILTLTSKPEPA